MTYTVSSAVAFGLEMLAKQMTQTTIEQPGFSVTFPYPEDQSQMIGKISVGSFSSEPAASASKVSTIYYLEVALETQNQRSNSSEWIITGPKDAITKALENIGFTSKQVLDALKNASSSLKKEVP